MRRERGRALLAIVLAVQRQMREAKEKADALYMRLTLAGPSL